MQIQNFALRLPSLTGDVYGITIRGSEPKSRSPLIQADQLRVRLKIVSLLRKKVDLNEIILRHPVVNFLVAKDGTTNLPLPRSRVVAVRPAYLISASSMFSSATAKSTTTTSRHP